MKKSVLSGLGAMALVVTLAGVGGVAGADLTAASARYPHTRQVLSEHVDLTALAQGHISEDGGYLTDDAPMAVAAWYMGRYHIEPYPDMVVQGQCMRLAKLNAFHELRQALVITLCPLGRGAQVYFNQTVYLGQ